MQPRLLRVVFLISIMAVYNFVAAQKGCPINIDFENGNLSEGWTCSAGTISRIDGSLNMLSGPAISGRHTIMQNVNLPNIPPQLDKYGGFPVTSPNGSRFSVRLGNESPGGQVDMISYSFTVPSDQQDYSIIYNYAVVLQDPAHPVATNQPRFTARVFDESTGDYLNCSSFAFTANSKLPGFKESKVKDSVFYKEWTPVTLKLAGYAGKQLRLEFTTFDCAPGGHFGYVYIDVNQNCSSVITGNVFCSNTDQITLTAPHGYSAYRWFSADLATLLSAEKKLALQPIPAAGTRYALEITPYPEQGCIDTLFTTLVASPEPMVLKVKDPVVACIRNGADLTGAGITTGSSGDLSFTYYQDILQTKPVQFPQSIQTSGQYYIVAENKVGCTDLKQTFVHIEPLPVFTVTDPAPVYKPVFADLSKTISSGNSPNYHFSYWLDTPGTKNVTTPLAVDKTGTYYIQAAPVTVPECTVMQSVQIMILDPLIVPPNIITPNGDQIHDTWLIPELSYYSESTVEIFNRYGHSLFRSAKGYTQPWDGKHDNKALPVGTYYYIIRLNNTLPVLTGSLTILR